MKKIILCLYILLLSFFINAQTQLPQWKFHLAFEDATGAKDTIWLIWDTNAINNHDSIFGEFPINLTPNTFQVYLFLDMPATNDTCKIFATEPSSMIWQSIHAKNYTYPIKISWDTSLFLSSAINSPVNCAEMDNDYFFFSGTVCETYNMLLNDTVIAPEFWWGSQEHFPLYISINTIGYCCVNGVDENTNIIKDYNLYPNPFRNKLIINNSNNIVKKVTIYSTDGMKVFVCNNEKMKNEIQLWLEFIENGIYIMEIINDKNQKYYEKIVKLFN